MNEFVRWSKASNDLSEAEKLVASLSQIVVLLRVNEIDIYLKAADYRLDNCHS